MAADITCKGCGKPMPGIKSTKIREVGYCCFGHINPAYHTAMENAKARYRKSRIDRGKIHSRKRL